MKNIEIIKTETEQDGIGGWLDEWMGEVVGVSIIIIPTRQVLTELIIIIQY